jgi:hypothetical protein
MPFSCATIIIPPGTIIIGGAIMFALIILQWMLNARR